MEKIKFFLKENKVYIVLISFTLLFVFFLSFDGHYSSNIRNTEFTSDGKNRVLSNSIYLDSGRYCYSAVIADLTSDDDVLFEVVDESELNSDNTLGKIIYSNIILKNATEHYEEFRIDKAREIKFQYTNIKTGSIDAYIRSTERLYYDKELFVLLALLFSVWLLCFKPSKRVLLLLGIALFSSLPLFSDYLLAGHDLSFHYGRILGISNSLYDGVFPAQILPNLYHGYGYGTSIFYPDFFLYIPAVLRLMGMTLLNSYKVLILLINVVSVLFSYFSFSRIAKSKNVGFIATVFYALAPYRLMDIYTRAAIGESLAMMFMPLALYGIYEIVYGDSKKWYIAAFGYTGILLSHLLSMEIVGIFTIIYLLCNVFCFRERNRIKHLLYAGVFTLVLCLWFFVPLIDHMKYPFVIFNKPMLFIDSSINPIQLFDTAFCNPTKGIVIGGMQEEMPYAAGVFIVLGTLLFVISRRNKRYNIFMYEGILFAYMATEYFPWNMIKHIEPIFSVFTSIQFPWRFLTMTTVLLSFVAAVGVCKFCINDELERIMMFVGCVLAVFCTCNYFSNYVSDALQVYSYDRMYYEEKKTVDEFYLLHDIKDDLYNANNLFTSSSDIVLSQVNRSEISAHFSYKAIGTKDGFVDIPLTYYPNYRAIDENGNSINIELSPQNKIRVSLKKSSQGIVYIDYVDPIYYWVARWISLVFCMYMIFLSIKSSFQNKQVDINCEDNICQ